jgi:hypothetical protein
MKEKAMYIGLGIVLGIVFSGQISKLPLVNRIPQV